MTHKQRVLELLADGQPHSHHELYALNVIAHSRIADLRRAGHQIECWRDGDLSYYRLVALAQPDSHSTEPLGAGGGESGGASADELDTGSAPGNQVTTAVANATPGADLTLFDIPVERERWAA